MGIFAYPTSQRVQLSRMTLVDNKKGFSSHITNGGNEYNMDIIDIQFNDIKIYGEYGSPDCPQNG